MPALAAKCVWCRMYVQSDGELNVLRCGCMMHASCRIEFLKKHDCCPNCLAQTLKDGVIECPNLGLKKVNPMAVYVDIEQLEASVALKKQRLEAKKAQLAERLAHNKAQSDKLFQTKLRCKELEDMKTCLQTAAQRGRDVLGPPQELGLHQELHSQQQQEQEQEQLVHQTNRMRINDD